MAEVPPFLWADSGDFDSPKVYEVPGAGEVQPYTATATFTNNSGQAILPALRIKSDTGNLLSLTFPVGQTVADGDSQEVTFVPPFGSAGSAASSTGFAPESCRVLNVRPTTYGVGNTVLTWDDTTFATDTPSTFALDAGNQLVDILVPGFYMASTSVVWNGGPLTRSTDSGLQVFFQDSTSVTQGVLQTMDEPASAAIPARLRSQLGTDFQNLVGPAFATYPMQAYGFLNLGTATRLDIWLVITRLSPLNVHT